MSECFENRCPKIAQYNDVETGKPEGFFNKIRSIGAAASVGVTCPGLANCLESTMPKASEDEEK